MKEPINCIACGELGLLRFEDSPPAMYHDVKRSCPLPPRDVVHDREPQRRPYVTRHRWAS